MGGSYKYNISTTTKLEVKKKNIYAETLQGAGFIGMYLFGKAVRPSFPYNWFA